MNNDEKGSYMIITDVNFKEPSPAVASWPLEEELSEDQLPTIWVYSITKMQCVLLVLFWI